MYILATFSNRKTRKDKNIKRGKYKGRLGFYQATMDGMKKNPNLQVWDKAVATPLMVGGMTALGLGSYLNSNKLKGIGALAAAGGLAGGSIIGNKARKAVNYKKDW